jgi:chromosome segregation ATPase
VKCEIELQSVQQGIRALCAELRCEYEASPLDADDNDRFYWRKESYELDIRRIDEGSRKERKKLQKAIAAIEQDRGNVKAMTDGVREDINNYDTEESNLVTLLEHFAHKCDEEDRRSMKLERLKEVVTDPLFLSEPLFTTSHVDRDLPSREKAELLAIESIRREGILGKQLSEARKEIEKLRGAIQLKTNEINTTKTKISAISEQIDTVDREHEQLRLSLEDHSIDHPSSQFERPNIYRRRGLEQDINFTANDIRDRKRRLHAKTQMLLPVEEFLGFGPILSKMNPTLALWGLEMSNEATRWQTLHSHPSISFYLSQWDSKLASTLTSCGSFPMDTPSPRTADPFRYH